MSQSRNTNAKGTEVLSAVERAVLLDAVQRLGEVEVHKRLRVSRLAMVRALAQLPVRPGTALLITTGLPGLCAHDGEDAAAA